MKRFAGALQFLTVLPIRGNTAPASEAAVFFPLAGALLGASAAGVFYAGQRVFGNSIAALLTIVWLVTITGSIHEDGLADVADAFRAGRSREKIAAILKDSRIGTYGAVALILSMVLRWQAVGALQVAPLYGLIAAVTLSRTAMVAMAAIAPAAGEGLGREFVAGIGKPVALAAVAQGVAAAFLTGWAHGAALVVATALVLAIARAWFVRRLGGVNGDCLGATCQLVETVNLLVLAWR